MSSHAMGNSDASGAIITQCGNYRLKLWRHWSTGVQPLVFIGLNPSTANNTDNDATIRKLMKFAKREHFGGIIVLNLFAYRATDPGSMKSTEEPDHQANNSHIQDVVSGNLGYVVVCWGTHGGFRGRDKEVLAMIREPLCFGVTKDGHPKHPLYLKDSTPLVPFNADRSIV